MIKSLPDAKQLIARFLNQQKMGAWNYRGAIYDIQSINIATIICIKIYWSIVYLCALSVLLYAACAFSAC